jgi:hypothetical protein
MDQSPGYEMEMGHVEDLVRYSKDAGYKFEFIIFTGGEPFLWRHIEDAAKAIRTAKIADVLTVYTNGLEIEKILSLKGLFTNLKITRYSYNGHAFGELNGLSNLTVKTLKHFSTYPGQAIEDSLPSDCGCRAYSMLGDQVYLCSFQPMLMAHYGAKIGCQDLDIVPMQPKFLDDFRTMNPFNRERCRWCFGNTKVASKTARIVNDV